MIVGLEFDPAGQRVGVAAVGFPRFTIWNVPEAKESGALDCRTDLYLEATTAIAWSPDGKMIALGISNGPIQLWQAQPPKPLAMLVGHRSGVLGLKFLPGGKTLVSSSTDATIKFWNLEGVASPKN